VTQEVEGTTSEYIANVTKTKLKLTTTRYQTKDSTATAFASK